MSDPVLAEVRERLARVEAGLEGVNSRLDLLIELRPPAPAPPPPIAEPARPPALGGAVVGAAGAGLGFGIVEALRRLFFS